MNKINQKPTSEFKDNIEKDNEIKMDLSTITEELRTLTYNEDYTRDNVLQAYDEMFRKSATIIKKYVVHPRVGNYIIGQKSESEDGKIFLHPDGRLVTFDYTSCGRSNDDAWESHKLEDVFDYLYLPQQILYNIYFDLKRHIKNNKEITKDLKLALYFMKVL